MRISEIRQRPPLMPPPAKKSPAHSPGGGKGPEIFPNPQGKKRLPPRATRAVQRKTKTASSGKASPCQTHWHVDESFAVLGRQLVQCSLCTSDLLLQEMESAHPGSGSLGDIRKAIPLIRSTSVMPEGLPLNKSSLEGTTVSLAAQKWHNIPSLTANSDPAQVK